ncbi:MAG TPA: DUF6701 domain-containing protein [Vicinamibacterales bacterium]|nr:DUF6701 domain-containing protein [Vicinamibacterales bacterium]
MVYRFVLALLTAIAAESAHAQTKFYFHDAASPNLGTLPGAGTMSATTPNVTAAGAGTNRDMDEVIGSAQTSVSINTLPVTTLQRNWFRRFVSRPLAAQTLPTGAWTIQGAASESAGASDMHVWGAVIKVWRPSTGTTVATLLDNPQLGATEPGTSQTNISTATGSIAGVAVNDGDVLVIELWSENVQSSANARVNTIFYDGTTEGSITSNAAFLQAPGAIVFHRSLRQSGYRFFNNADSTDVGAVLAGQNTAATLSATGDAFRLRMLIHVADVNMGIGGQSFKLQFVGKGTGTCAAPSGGTPAAWTDVTGATLIAFNNNVTPADGAALTANGNDPAHAGDTIVNQTYEEANNFTNASAINRGQDGKWDFALLDNGAAASATYCLRAVKSDGTPLDTYYFYPEITTAAASALGGFNAYDTSTAPGAVTGNITTKVAGSNTSVAVIALNAAKNAIQTGFTGTVRVEVLDASNNTGALDANGCRATWSVIQTISPDPVFVAGDNGRKTVTFNQANSYPNARVRISYPVGAPTATGCSNDNFAIRPASFAVAASDNTWDSAGTARTLDNTATTGGVVHKAGRNFTIRLTPAPATATNYDGSPNASLSTVACTLPAPCANGALALGTFNSIGSGVRESTTATYSEAGAFNLTLVDDSYAAVDNADGTPADCTATGRYVCSSAVVTVGRFVPDHFAFTSPNTPQFRTFDTAACAGRSFTYVGQPFGYVTAPSATVEARSAGGTVTTNYRGALFKLLGASLSQSYAMPGKTINPSLQTAVLSAVGDGTATYTAHANDKIAFNRHASTPDAPFNATIALTWVAEDSSENVASQGIITTSPSLVFNAIGFDAGSEFRYGRLRLANANGSQLASLPVLMELQYRNAMGAFITNAADSCTSIASEAVSMTFTPNLVPSPNCKTLLSGGGQFSSGRRTLVLSAPGNGNQGAATLTVNLNGAGATTTCTVAGAPAAAQDAARPWLQGNWTTTTYTQDASARATFGAFPGAGEVIFIRENF